MLNMLLKVLVYPGDARKLSHGIWTKNYLSLNVSSLIQVASSVV